MISTSWCVVVFGWLLSAVLALGQGIRDLATNVDGSTLYFSSSLRIKGSSQYLHSKIFTWDNSNGVRLYEQRPPDVPFPFPVHGFRGAQFFGLIAPDVSSDGSTVAVTGGRFCTGSDTCVISVEEYQATIYATGKPAIEVPGSAILSRNGRYALLRSSIFPVVGNVKISLLDLETGQQTAYAAAWELAGGKHQVANDGTVALATTDGFSLGRGGQLRSVGALASSSPNPLINAAGSLVIYQSGGGSFGPARLSVYSVTNGSLTELVTETADAPDFRPSISDDGALVAFLYGSNRQVYVIGKKGIGLRQVTSFSDPVTEVELSGDGTVAFAVTADNRVVRIDVATAQSVDIVPPTPYTVTNIRVVVSRGAVTSIGGSGFAAASQSAEPPFPLTLSGVELHVGGIVAPIAGVSPTSVSYPAPWGLPDSPVDVEVWVSSASASPFVPGFQVEPAGPSFYVDARQTLLAVHQDFASLVSAESPAQPGEYIYVYAKDLGPVTPAPAAGLAAPLQPLSQLALPISCTFGISAVPVNISFAGLAPELLNVFQVNLRMPDSFQAGPSSLSCQVGDPSLRFPIGGSLPVQ